MSHVQGANRMTASMLKNEIHNRSNGHVEELWKSFLYRFVAGSFTVIGILVAINFLANPAGYYPLRLLPRLTANDIIEKEALLGESRPHPQLLILGSSRCMKLKPSVARDLSGLTSFNAATSAGEPVDMLDVLEYSADHLHIVPKIVVIGLDLEMFHNGPHRTAHLPPFLERIQALLSPDMTEQSIRSLRFWMRRAYPSPLRRFDPDGYLHDLRIEDEERRGTFQSNREMDDLLAYYRPIWKSYTGLSKDQLFYLRRLLEFCRSRHILMIVFLTPRSTRMANELHDLGYESRLIELQSQLEAICNAANVEYLDLSKVSSFGGAEDDFYDGVHVKEHNAQRILERLFENKHALQ